MFYSLINMVAELMQNKIQCIEILSVSTKVVQTQAFPTHIQHNISVQGQARQSYSRSQSLS